jgi:hypothetical protein
MPRSYVDIVRMSEAMAESLEQDASDPTISDEESALRAAALRRSLAENELGQAVVAARGAGLSWAVVGAAVGTSGEAARQRYGKLAGEHVSVGKKKPTKRSGYKIRGRKVGGTKVITFKVGGGTTVTKTSDSVNARQHVPAVAAARKAKKSDWERSK